MSKSDKHDKGIEIHARVLISRFGKKRMKTQKITQKNLKRVVI